MWNLDTVNKGGLNRKSKEVKVFTQTVFVKPVQYLACKEEKPWNASHSLRTQGQHGLNEEWTRVNVHFVNHDHATDKNNDHFSY